MSNELNTLSLAFAEQLYARFLENPESVSPDWRRYFESLPDGDGTNGDAAFRSRPQLGPSFERRSVFNPGGSNGSSTASTPASSAPTSTPAPPDGSALKRAARASEQELQDRVDQLVRAYRVRGHLVASVDPLERPTESVPEMDPDFYGFTEEDMEKRFSSDTIEGPDRLRLREIIQRLRNTYCRNIGVQFMHMDELPIRQWLQRRMEASENRRSLSRANQLRILTQLTDAIIFEDFIQKKFLGAKSFSLEGAETLIPLLDLAIEKSGRQGTKEIVLGMAHRGRLNVLANIMGKDVRQIFREFDESATTLRRGEGDVKYHLGHSRDWHTDEGHEIHISLCFNPSHLEFVNTVVLGRTRAKQDRHGDHNRQKGMALLIHGDAAFAGEGIVQETLNLSQLPGYRVGGALHVVVNNQIGFTTPPQQGRSCHYATDVAKMLQSPIFHVNGEDPEAVAQVVDLALDFRMAFQRDVVIDMYCFRRRGHNEGDEPSFTQPEMYRAIRARKSVRQGYLDHLVQLGEIDRAEADRIVDQRREALDEALTEVRREEKPQGEDGTRPFRGLWSAYTGGPDEGTPRAETRIPRERIVDLLFKLTQLPERFTPHKKIERYLKQRGEMAAGKRPLDWAAGEALALASLADEGARIRLSGQDAERGTFSHRHAKIHDFENGNTFMPLSNLSRDQAWVDVINSPLSEAGVIGFDYGYSLDCPDGLILWEAQFGDFSNAAQVMFDQFIASAECKWRRLSGLVMLLPHGLEGMGPEHSSARLERFLSLCAEDNMQVVNLTTPAQIFHCLRRQVRRPWRKPLVVMSPKSLLRHPKVVSTLDDLADGEFQRLIPDALGIVGKNVRKVLLCSGKVYYDLIERREKTATTDVAIIRVEQLYPLDPEDIGAVLDQYDESAVVTWVQEEPENNGAWPHLRLTFGDEILGRPLQAISRPPSASPATGSSRWHKQEQQELIDAAFA